MFNIEAISLPRPAKLGLLVSLFLLPLELVITQGAHGLLDDWIGLFYLVAHPFTLLIVTLALFEPGALLEVGKVRINWLIAAMATGIVFSTIVMGASPEASFRYIYFGCLSIVAGMAIVRLSRDDDHYLLALFYGCLAWAVLVLVAYAYYAATYPATAGLSFSEALLLLRNPGPKLANGQTFFLLVGNVNKVANYAVLFMLLSAYLRLKRAIDLPLFLASQLAMTAILIICFSRGGFVACGLLGALLLTIWSYEHARFKVERPRMLIAAALMMIPVLASVSTGEFRSYWTDFSSMQIRLDMEEHAVGVRVDPDRDVTTNSLNTNSAEVFEPSPIFGYGIGFFGQTHFRSMMAGTHNLFLDLWTIGGVLGAASLICFICGWIMKSIRSTIRRPTVPVAVGLAGLSTIVVLGLREYDLAYLWATSLGGMFLGLFAGLCQADQNAK